MINVCRWSSDVIVVLGCCRRAIAVLALAWLLTFPAVGIAEDPDLSSARNRASYAYGMHCATVISRYASRLDGSSVLAGLIDGLAGHQSRMSPEVYASMGPKLEKLAKRRTKFRPQRWPTEPSDRIDFDASSEREQLGYAVGLDLGGNTRERYIRGLEPLLVVRGVVDALAQQQRLTDDQYTTARDAFIELATRQESIANADQAAAFLAANRHAEGVYETASGLQYRVLRLGGGRRPAVSSRVDVHYRGYLLDGTEFDNSYKKGKPATFRLGDVIPGWEEVLQLMDEGSQFEVWLPADLAYGDRGTSGVIGPNAALHFELELIRVH